MAKRVRLDELLVRRGLAESRSRAKALVLAGRVRRGTEVLDKAGRLVPEDLEVAVQETARYVSRGGDKLESWFRVHPWDLAGKRFLDVGASTGGFSDFLLQHGAAEGTCLDVGHGQLHYRLRTDQRITNLERINARHLQPSQLPHPAYPVIVMDLSFISLRTVLPRVWPLLDAGGLMVALVKPQFEAGREEADRARGVITDEAVRQRVLGEILEFVAGELAGSRLLGWVESAVAGTSGNREYLAGWTREEAGAALTSGPRGG